MCTSLGNTPAWIHLAVVLFVIYARNLLIGSPADLGVGIYISRIDGKYKLESPCLCSNIFF